MAATGLQSKANREAQVQALQSKSHRRSTRLDPAHPGSHILHGGENKTKLTLANKVKIVSVTVLLTLLAALTRFIPGKERLGYEMEANNSDGCRHPPCCDLQCSRRNPGCYC